MMRIGIVALLVVALGCSKETRVETTSAAPVPPATTTTAAAAPVAPPLTAAHDLVADLYAQHGQGNSPFFQTDDRTRLEKYFEPKFAELIWNDAVSAQGEVGVLGFDPLYDAQDTEIKNFVVQPATVEGDGAQVAAEFSNFGENQRIVYSLVPVAGQWRISDMTFADGRTLRKAFEEAAAETAATSTATTTTTSATATTTPPATATK